MTMRETEVQRLALIGAVLISTAASTATFAATQEQCNAEWTKADKDVDGDLSSTEVTRHLIAIMKDAKHRGSGKQGKITFDDFMVACKDGVFDAIISKGQ